MAIYKALLEKLYTTLNLLTMGLLRGVGGGCSRIWGYQKGPLPKICLTYTTMMTLGTVIPYLKKIQKIYKSRDTLFEFCLHQHFLTENLQILLCQEIQI